MIGDQRLEGIAPAGRPRRSGGLATNGSRSRLATIAATAPPANAAMPWPKSHPILLITAPCSSSRINVAKKMSAC
jgi:hypothetical protein